MRFGSRDNTIVRCTAPKLARGDSKGTLHEGLNAETDPWGEHRTFVEDQAETQQEAPPTEPYSALLHPIP